MSLTPPPSPPLRSDPPAVFIAKAEAYLSWQQTFVSEMEAAVEVANITLWVSGTTYAVGDVVWSPTNNKSYRRIIAGAGTTDPVSDAVNWSAIPYAASGANADITSASAMAPWSNGLINGGFELWPNGTSVAVPASSNAYTAANWRLETTGSQACTVSQQAGLVDGSQYSGRVQRNSGQTGVGAICFEQWFELSEIVKYRGKKITVNYLLSTGANWSPTSGMLNIRIFCGTGAARARGGAAYTGESNPINTFDNIAAGSAAAEYIHTSAVVIPTNATQMTLYFFWTPVGTAGADDWFQIDDVMWSVGTAAQPFERKDAVIGIPQNSKSAAYTTVLADANTHLLHPSADTTARTFTIDSNANVPYPIGTAITFVNQNAAGVLTIAITTDTMRLAGAGTTGSRTLAANGMATALKLTATEWIISGTGLT